VNETVDDITIEYEEDGVSNIKQVDKVVLSKGAWASILFRYQQRDSETGEYGPDKYALHRYQKVSGTYRKRSKFNISSDEQARKIAESLLSWIGPAEK
jgi:hypothetical protein